MLILSVVVSSLVALATGSCLGIIAGFCMASHHDVLAGFQPKTTNSFLLFVCRPTSEFSSVETVLFLLLVIGWLVLFVLLCAAPIIIAGRLSEWDNTAMNISLAVFLVASYLARNIGKNLWLRLI